MTDLVETWPWIAQIAAIMLALNVALAGIKSGLDIMKDHTEAKWDNKASALLGKVLGWGSKIIDLLGMNPSHRRDA